VVNYSGSMDSIQTQPPNPAPTARHLGALIGGLLFPGLGQLIRFRAVSALFVFMGTVTPILWTALILNQLVNDRVIVQTGEPRLLVLDGTFIAHLGALGPVPPEITWFGGLGLAIYLFGAIAAYGD
jgi:hypothetical protein